MKMKWKFSALALCTAVSLTAFNAAAAEKDADFKVIGTIAPAACTPTFPNGAVADYGSISPATLTAATPALNQLGTKKVSMDITCSSQTVVALKAMDNRADSEVTLSEDAYIANAGSNQVTISGNEQAYGLGTASDVNIGAYTLAVNVSAVSVADAAGEVFEADVLTTRATTLIGATWTKAVGGFLNPTNGTAGTHLAFAKKGSLTPVAIKTASVPLSVSAAVQPMSEFTAGETITLNGLATISLVYL